MLQQPTHLKHGTISGRMGWLKGSSVYSFGRSPCPVPTLRASSTLMPKKLLERFHKGDVAVSILEDFSVMIRPILRLPREVLPCAATT